MLIQSVRRAIRVLNAFSLSKPMLGISEISRELGLKKGTIQGLVRTLAHEGFLQQDPETRKYQLGLKIYELGVILSGSLEINQKASTLAYQLAKKTQLLVRVAILDGDSALVTLDAYPRSQPFISRQFGPRGSLYCSAIGKSILAFFGPNELNGYLEKNKLIPYTSATITTKNKLIKELKDIRENGYSLNRGENFVNRAAIGAPIYSRSGKVLHSICISGDISRVLGENNEMLIADVIKTSNEISRLMGYFFEANNMN